MPDLSIHLTLFFADRLTDEWMYLYFASSEWDLSSVHVLNRIGLDTGQSTNEGIDKSQI